MEIINAYPTPIGSFEFENCEYLNQGLVEFLYDIRDKEKSLEISSKDTIFFIRGTPVKDSHLDLISEIERIGFTCINSRNTISICADNIVVM